MIIGSEVVYKYFIDVGRKVMKLFWFNKATNQEQKVHLDAVNYFRGTAVKDAI